MYSYAETSGFGLSWLLAIVPFNIGPKYEFVSIWSKTVQNRNPIPVQIRFKMPGTILHGRTILHSRVVQNCPGLSFRLYLDCAFQIGPKHEFPSNLVQTSPKYQWQSRFISI